MAGTMTDAKPTLLIVTDTKTFDVSPWVDEGYDIHLITSGKQRDIEDVTDDLESSDRYAILAFGAGATAALEFATHPSRQLLAVSAYYPVSLPASVQHPGVKILLHLPSSTPFSAPTSPSLQVRLYDAAPGFVIMGSPAYNRIAASLAFSRSLALFRATIGPPMVDLEAIWDEHTLYEFVDKDADKTLGTMVSNPYVNHVPVLTGGVGYDNLHRFYRDFFIPKNPPNLRMTLVSRTVGSDRIVDEMVASFTHTCTIDWMLPGVPPTGKDVQVALVSIVCIRGGKLYHEHIYWDNASVLKQIGLLDGLDLPVAGAESAQKVLDERSVESNAMIPTWRK